MHKTAKKNKLRALAILRKSERIDGYANIKDFQNGIFDVAEHVSPWTNNACNVDTDLMIVGQDWASSDWLSNPANATYASLGRNPNLATNKNLEEYLNLFKLKFQDVYATNAFVHIKNGHMSRGIPSSIFLESVKKYLLPQIEIVSPKMVICLGSKTFNSVRKALGAQPITIAEGHLKPISFKHSNIFGVYHTGGLGTAGAGGKPQALKQWHHLAQVLKNS